MLVPVIKDFKVGHDSFVAGEKRNIDDEVALKYARRGWVFVKGVTPEHCVPEDITLNIHNATQGMTTNGE